MWLSGKLWKTYDRLLEEIGRILKSSKKEWWSIKVPYCEDSEWGQRRKDMKMMFNIISNKTIVHVKIVGHYKINQVWLVFSKPHK